jgi:RimJ/RimL family protein N-acetyltransferase
MRRRGVTIVKFATVDPANETAIAFYQKLGCTLLRTGQFYRDNPVHVYVYDVSRHQ